MAITSDVKDVFEKLENESTYSNTDDERLSRYYQGSQRLVHLGLAVPPELRAFETIVNWPRLYVDAIEQRQDVKMILRPGETKADPWLQDLYRVNNLASDLSLYRQDLYVYGRAFLCVGSNEDDPEHPLITVESPREMTVEVDARSRRLRSALRLYNVQDGQAQNATLYLPDKTVWFERGPVGWAETDRDEHLLGRLPIVMGLNRRMTGDWSGVSQMADVIGLTDAAARSLTNLQVAQETHAVPARWAAGMSKGDFADADGNLLPTWEAYYGAVWATENGQAKFGQFSASDLKNFHETVELYAKQVAALTGLPADYYGINTTNPPGEGAIRALEARLVKTTDRKNAQEATVLGWALGIAERIKTGEWPQGSRVDVQYHDPGTPTFAQKADALQKLAGGKSIISREGAWDELGWSAARKDQERGYMEAELSAEWASMEPVSVGE
jgi:hypothetical protein